MTFCLSCWNLSSQPVYLLHPCLLYIRDPLCLIGVSRVSMDRRFFTGAWATYQWLYPKRKWQPFHQQPLTAHCPSGRGRALWAPPLSRMKCWWVQFAKVLCRQPQLEWVQGEQWLCHQEDVLLLYMSPSSGSYILSIPSSTCSLSLAMCDVAAPRWQGPPPSLILSTLANYEFLH